MSNCKFNHEGTCYNCGSPQFKRDCETPCVCRPPMTNFERIRNMTLEEMANALYERPMSYVDCEKYCAYTKDGRCDKFDDDGKGSCVDGIKLWLESEVEE